MIPMLHTLPLIVTLLSFAPAPLQEAQAPVAAPSVTTAPAKATSPQEALALARSLADSNPALCSMYPIGKSWTGQPIEVIAISSSVVTADSRPSVLIVAGLDGNRPSSVGIAVDAVRKLIATPDALKETTFYVIPCANPDAYAIGVKPIESAALRNLHPTDEDRDGVADEDPPRDVNADGFITSMRRLNPPADDPPTHLKDPADSRLMRQPNASKDLRANYTIYIEGFDTDGDGLIAEDGVGGVDVDRNFPHRWQQFDRTAGITQLSEPESMALAKFVLGHPRIIAALVLGRWDSLTSTPDTGPRDITGRTPQALDGQDKATWEELGKIWRDLSLQSRTQSADPAGSMALWLYAHRGIPAFATQLWGRPDASGLPAPAAADPVAPAPTSPPPAPPAPEDAEALGWLQWNDRDMQGIGFVAWSPFTHPTLGEVEVGGWAARFRSDPPPKDLDRLSTAVAGFSRELAARQPRIALEGVTAKALADGIVQIDAALVNNGWLPTATAMGRANHAPAQIIVRLSAPKDRILAGQRVTMVEGLDGAGGRQKFKWIVRTDPGERLTLEATWAPQGTIGSSITAGVVAPLEARP